MGDKARRADLEQEQRDLTEARPALASHKGSKVIDDEVARIDRRLGEINEELS
jgi:hypothetical protein